jgi:NADH:ubiquinone oxidoreductase subunit 3 (subunit A)
MIPRCRPGDRSAQHEEEGAVGENWAFVAILTVIALTIPILGILAAMVLAPRRPGVIKNSTYECGLETVGDAWVQFKVQYYLYALIFVLFDVETVFLYPWAVAYQSLPLLALFEMIIFLLILGIGLVYAWRKGALEWI